MKKSKGRAVKKIGGNAKNIFNIFFELLLNIKIMHFSTTSYAEHKATDKLHESLSDLSDKFIEVYIGRRGRENISDNDIQLNNDEYAGTLLYKNRNKDEFIEYLNESLKIINNIPEVASYNELITIRDEILAEISKTLYLLTLK
jgi:hypothetical protein